MGGDDSTERAIDLMAQTLQVEYRFIIYYPRLADMVPNGERISIVRMLGADSVKHADVVSQVIRALGGAPPFPAMERFPDLPIQEIFERQLEYEKLALVLYSQAVEVAGPEWREAIMDIAAQERRHIQELETILERLG